jgi:tryptophanyl-tRNA synthetase
MLEKKTFIKLYKYSLPSRNMAKEMKVTPWEVSGEIDYNKLIKEFGLSPMKELPEIFSKNVLFRRKIVFAHRDIQRILEAAKQKKPFAMMTGLMPTGKFHIGHMLLANQMIFWQNLGAKIYIAVADLEAYNARGQSLEESRKNAVEQYILNYIALGLKPENCDIYFQSSRSNDAKKSNAFYSLQNVLAKHATFNEFKAVYGEITPGKMVSALLQAADMLHPQLKEFEGPLPTLIPVGVDQDPHIRLARDISQRFKEYKFIQLSSTYHIFAPGLKGGKMSSSDPNSFIALTDSAKEVEEKIKKHAFSGGQPTLELQRKKGGNPDIDVSYQYLRMLFEPDDKKLEKIYNDYKSGKLLTGELKQILIDKVNAFLKEHQKKREAAKSQIGKFLFKG